VNVKVTLPLVSAVSVPTVGPLKLRVTVSPGLKLVPVTVIDVPGAACGGSNASAALPWLMVKEADAVLPLVRPFASTPYWPGGVLGTVNARLKVPPLLTSGVPTTWPLNETSTVSPGAKPEPLTVTVEPGRPELGDNDSAGPACGVVASVGVIVAGPVAWPRAVAGANISAARTSTRTSTTDPVAIRSWRERL
jgi:hypothetical protein